MTTTFTTDTDTLAAAVEALTSRGFRFQRVVNGYSRFEKFDSVVEISTERVDRHVCVCVYLDQKIETLLAKELQELGCLVDERRVNVSQEMIDSLLDQRSYP